MLRLVVVIVSDKNMGAMLLQKERERLDALQRYCILDTPRDGAFDHLTAVAADFFRVPIALVSLVDRDCIWFKFAPWSRL